MFEWSNMSAKSLPFSTNNASSESHYDLRCFSISDMKGIRTKYTANFLYGSVYRFGSPSKYAIFFLLYMCSCLPFDEVQYNIFYYVFRKDIVTLKIPELKWWTRSWMGYRLAKMYWYTKDNLCFYALLIPIMWMNIE